MPAALKQPQENLARVSRNTPVRRTVLVTGGTEGIGPAICKKMAELGHFVATTYRDEAKARAWQDRMEQEGYLFFIYEDDAADPEKSRDLIEAVTEYLGPIQVLINKAGINDPGGAPYLARAVIGDMLATGFGRIVNISSAGGQGAGLDQAGYEAATADMHEFTKVLAQDVARKGITVNTISPGYVATDMIRPEDIAHVVSFLVSEDSGFITGANIDANGGYFTD